MNIIPLHRRTVPLRVPGCGRDAENDKSVCFYFSRSVTDDELRYLHEVMERAVACMPQKNVVENVAGVAEQSGSSVPDTSVRCGAPTASNLCPDCPPAGYLNDKTRCDPCPRKACDHDWQIWPETDGQEQRCMKCGKYRKTQLDIEDCGNHSAGSPP